jgi:hypothetical protein
MLLRGLSGGLGEDVGSCRLPAVETGDAGDIGSVTFLESRRDGLREELRELPREELRELPRDLPKNATEKSTIHSIHRRV